MIRIGVIGAGNNARGHIRNFSQLSDRSRIAAVADPVLALAQEAVDGLDAVACDSFDQFLDDVDAVIISSPNFLHPEHAIACAEAGKHVWIEKPMALNTADAKGIVDAVKRHNVKSFVGFSVRFDGLHQLFKSHLEENKLGRPLSIWSRRLAFSRSHIHKTWRNDFEKSGGVMSEIIAHEIDWIVHLVGQPESVFCRIRGRNTDHPLDNDHVWITFNFADGLTGTIEGSMMSPMPEYYRGVSGEDAAVYTNKWSSEAYLVEASTSEDKKEPVELSIPGKFDKASHFLDIIEGKADSQADAQWGLNIVSLTDALLESARSVSVVPLSNWAAS